MSDIHYFHLETVRTTQTEIDGYLQSAHPDQWTVLTADCQTAGIGQYSRCWFSPNQGNLYASIAIPYEQKISSIFPLIPLITALAICEILEEEKINPKIKWVNDIFIDGKKICGILCHNKMHATLIGYNQFTVGVGLNINMDPECTPELPFPWTSLYREIGQKRCVKTILRCIIDRLQLHFANLIQFGFPFFLPSIESRLECLNDLVSFEHSGQVLKGVFKGIGLQGELLLLHENTIKAFNSGRLLYP